MQMNCTYSQVVLFIICVFFVCLFIIKQCFMCELLLWIEWNSCDCVLRTNHQNLILVKFLLDSVLQSELYLCAFPKVRLKIKSKQNPQKPQCGKTKT